MRDKSSIYQKQNTYSIFLGNDIKLSYTTKKDLNYALAEINRRLNAIIFELNELWILSFTEYRRLWFYLPGGNAVIAQEFHILELQGELHKFFTLLSDRSSWVNGNVFSFKYLFNIIKDLNEIFSMLSVIRKKKGQFIEYNVIQVRIRTLNKIMDDLKNLSVNSRYAAGSESTSE